MYLQYPWQVIERTAVRALHWGTSGTWADANVDPRASDPASSTSATFAVQWVCVVKYIVARWELGPS